MIMTTPAEFEDKLNYIFENSTDEEEIEEQVNDLVSTVLRENGYDRGVDVLERYSVGCCVNS